MRRLSVLFLLILIPLCGEALARGDGSRDRGGPAQYERQYERERQRDPRDEYRVIREQLRQNPYPSRNSDRGRNDDDRRSPSLRRLDPQDREQLRRDMREAARDHYRR